jgi:alpha,alpha-trehalose phosphorylase
MLRFAPRLPPALTRLAFTVVTGGRRLRVEATPSTVTYTLSGDGPPVQIGHHGQPIMLTDGCAETRDIPPLPDRPEPTQPPGREPARCTPPGP